MVGDEEYQVSGPTATEEFQAEYTDCHAHGASMLATHTIFRETTKM
jgi:zinc transporter 1/2/3